MHRKPWIGVKVVVVGARCGWKGHWGTIRDVNLKSVDEDKTPHASGIALTVELRSWTQAQGASHIQTLDYNDVRKERYVHITC